MPAPKAASREARGLRKGDARGTRAMESFRKRWLGRVLEDVRVLRYKGSGECLEKGVITATVVPQPLAVKEHCLRCDAVEKRPVVADDDNGPVPALQKLLEPAAGQSGAQGEGRRRETRGATRRSCAG